MIILGLNLYHADSSAALIKDGEIVCAVEEERFNRIKHYSGFPKESIKSCLKIGKMKMEDINYIAIAGNRKSYLKDKILYALKRGPRYLPKLIKKASFYKRGISIKDEFSKYLGFNISNKTQVKFIDHHQSHLSSFFLSPFEQSAILSIDGFGDFCSMKTAYGRNNEIEILSESKYPNSLGIVYTAVTQWLGFWSFGAEFKVMGLAPYGKPKYLNKVKKLVKFERDGTFKNDLSYFVYDQNPEIMSWNNVSPFIEKLYSNKFEELFGAAREEKDKITQYHKDVAASLQTFLEQTVYKILKTLHKTTKSENLVLTGGVAANSVLAGKIAQETPFKNVFVPPAPGDGGNSLGAALFVSSQLLRKPRTKPLQSAALGPMFFEREIEKELKKYGLNYKRLNENAIITETARLIAEGNIIGWFQGKMEFGSRALGHRSILADPRQKEMKKVLNSRVKHRESFRPFAPSILEEKASKYFDNVQPSPYMSHVLPIKKNKQKDIAATVHTDRTGRIQTVSKSEGKYYTLIKEFEKITNVPVLLNTSFNDNEPIVCSPNDAIECFLNTKIDYLVLENFITKK